MVTCANCQQVLCQPTGGRAKLTEGCSFRVKEKAMMIVGWCLLEVLVKAMTYYKLGFWRMSWLKRTFPLLSSSFLFWVLTLMNTSAIILLLPHFEVLNHLPDIDSNIFQKILHVCAFMFLVFMFNARNMSCFWIWSAWLILRIKLSWIKYFASLLQYRHDVCMVLLTGAMCHENCLNLSGAWLTQLPQNVSSYV